MRIIPWLLIATALAGCNARSHGGETANSGVTIDIPPANSVEANSAAEAPPRAAIPEPPALPAAAPVPPKADKSASPPDAGSLPKPDRRKPPKPVEDSEASDQTTETAAPAPAAATGPRAPLSDSAIVGTVRRIGYSCDSVASSNRVSGTGESAVYKIVCASGDSYRATRKNGRLVFRLWGRGAADPH